MCKDKRVYACKDKRVYGYRRFTSICQRSGSRIRPPERSRRLAQIVCYRPRRSQSPSLKRRSRTATDSSLRVRYVPLLLPTYIAQINNQATKITELKLVIHEKIGRHYCAAISLVICNYKVGQQ